MGVNHVRCTLCVHLPLTSPACSSSFSFLSRDDHCPSPTPVKKSGARSGAPDKGKTTEETEEELSRLSRFHQCFFFFFLNITHAIRSN